MSILIKIGSMLHIYDFLLYLLDIFLKVIIDVKLLNINQKLLNSCRLSSYNCSVMARKIILLLQHNIAKEHWNLVVNKIVKLFH